MDETETLYLRFLRSGLTLAGTVRRIGHTMTVNPGDDDYGVLALTEKEQRSRWGNAFYEHLTADEYAVASVADAVTPEAAALPRTPPPPGTDGDPDLVRGGGNQPAPAPSTHTGPAPVAPAAQPADPRWPWYNEANVPQVLAQVAGMSEAEVPEFLAYEQSMKNRAGVTGPMTGR